MLRIQRSGLSIYESVVFFGSDNQRRYVYASQANTHIQYNTTACYAIVFYHSLCSIASYVYYVIHKSYTNVDNTKVQ